ncbi:MAG: alpha/beta fold hydrolase [Clostridia bacterium]|nr:alpha/beta fold hydrolase [Clostridia bacterium]
MKIFLIVVIALAAVYILYRAGMFIFASVIYKAAFGKRFDKNPLLKYYSADDFNLNVLAVQTKVGKNTIRGFIYSFYPLEECKRLVIFAHGIGPGQCAYTTEIAYFCKNGCAVLAFDAAGCNLSDGKKLGSLENATRCLAAAVRFANADERLKGKKKIAVGHSMGAYAALCVTQFEQVDGVVAFSAPDTPSGAICYLAECTIKKSAKKLKPYLKAVSRLKAGKYANISASRAIEKSGVKALILQGDSDIQVPVYLSAYAYAKGSNVNKVMCAGKGHNTYNTKRAEEQLAVLSRGLAKCDSMSGQEQADFFSSRDYSAICEEDMSVMSAVSDFIMTV